MARVVVIAAAQLSAERALMRDECPRPAARSKPASRTPRWRRPATARTRTVTTCSSRRSGRDAWFAAAPRPLRVQWLLAGRSGRTPGARVPKKSRFSPVSGLSVDCGGILPCVAGPCFKRRMTHLAAAPQPHRVRRLLTRRSGGETDARLFDGTIGIGIVRALAVPVVEDERKPGGMRGQMEQGDLLAVAGRHLD